MKIRSGFVSNSSTSSFVCEISNKIVTNEHCVMGADFAKCTCGHQFLGKYLLDPTKVKPKTIEDKKELLNYLGESCRFNLTLEKLFDNAIDELYNNYKKDIKEALSIDKKGDRKYFYNAPSFLCPICAFEKFSEKEILSWLLMQKYGSPDIKLAIKDIKKIYKTYEDFAGSITVKKAKKNV